MKIHKNDNIIVITGKDKGKQGKVLKAYPAELKVVVEKINVSKKHLKPTNSAPHGGIKEIEMPIGISKIMVVCPHCSKPTRIGHKITGENKNVRICKLCKETVDQI
ncbi:MAG: 50S ribosomal protein L24 [Patescibacteria group bacterium]|jgi:large subunit ribosomal protein L24